MTSPTSSGDEKDWNNSSNRKKSGNQPNDSGLSEDHGSTGSSGSNNPESGHERLHHHLYRKHLAKTSGLSTDKVRRSSTDSARSSTHHDDLDLNLKPSGSVIAGADDVSDNSRPGTPLCDERQDQPQSNTTASSTRTTTARSSSPMSLPLPKFATQMLANHIQTSSYLTAKKERPDPRLKSPSNLTLSVSTCLKSPPPSTASLKSPSVPPPSSGTSSSRIIPDHSNSSTANATPSESVISGKPHDPRLGLLQLKNQQQNSHQASKHPTTLPLIKTNSLMNDIEDISDSDREEDHKEQEAPSSAPNDASRTPTVTNNPPAPVKDPALMSLEERLKALDEKYERWSGSAYKVASSGTPSQQTPATPVSATPLATASTAAAPASVPIAKEASSAASSSNASVPSSAEIAPPSSATSGASSASTASSLNKFSFDLKPTQPSPIVQRLLSRRSVFDEDTKRLENLNSTEGEAANAAGLNSPQVLPGGAVNFGSECPPTTPVITSVPAPLPASATVSRSVSVDGSSKMQPQTSVKPMLNKMNSLTTELKPKVTMTTASNLIRPQDSSPAIGQVRPVTAMVKASPSQPLPHILGPSTASIKPLVDNKTRPALASTKPSATVTPTFKSSTTSHQAQSMRRNSTLTTTTASNKALTMCTTSTTSGSGSGLLSKTVEKGEASSTTSSPKPSEIKVEQVDQLSPESSTHPEVSSCMSVSPPTEEESGVSSTTKEPLDIKAALKIKKEPLDPFTSILKDVKKEVKVDQNPALFAPALIQNTKTILPPTKDHHLQLEPKLKDKDGSKKDRSSSKESSRHGGHHHSSSKERKPHKDMNKKIKEMKDKDLKDLFAATDTIPNHVKKEPKKPSDKKSENSSSEHKKHSSSHSHHSHSHGDKHHSSSGHGHHSSSHSHSHKSSKDQKRRLSDANAIDESAPKSKVAKSENSSSNNEVVVKNKMKSESVNGELKMGRIPKIKKLDQGSSSSVTEKDAKKSSHGIFSSSKVSSKSDDHKKHLSSSSKDKKAKDGSSGSKKESEKSKSSSSHSSSSKKRPSHHSSGDEEQSAKKKHKEGHRSSSHSGKSRTSVDEKKSRDHNDKKENRRKSTSSQASNSSKKDRDLQLQHQKKMTVNSDASDFSDDDNPDQPKKFSIFDDPVIDLDNPVYFSMYDKVKARRSCVAKRDREENERRQQEALLAKFKRLKAKRDGKPGDDDSDSDNSNSGNSDSNEIKQKKKHMISSSSEGEDEGHHDSSSMKKKVQIKTKKAISDSSSSDDSDSDQENKTKSSSVKKSSPSKKVSSSKKASRSGLLDSSDEEMEDSKQAIKNRKILPTKSATAKVKTEMSSSDSDDDSEFVQNRNKAAATAVLVQNKKKANASSSSSSKTSKAAKAAKHRQPQLSSSDSSDSSDSSQDHHHHKNQEAASTEKATEKATSVRPSSPSPQAVSKRKSSSESSEKSKKDLKKEKMDLDKKMSKIFGSSSDEETTPKATSAASKEPQQTSKLFGGECDSEKEAVKEQSKKAAKKIRRKERNSSGRSSCGSSRGRETAESLFDQLTVNTGELVPNVKSEMTSPAAAASKLTSPVPAGSEDYKAFAEGVAKEAVSNTSPVIKTEIGPLDQQLQAESIIGQEQSELDKSIASITEDVKEKAAIKDEDMEVDEPSNAVIKTEPGSAANSNSKRSVTSQEETDQAVAALLGESFENSFEADKSVSEPIEVNTNVSQMETENAVAAIEDENEAAKAVASLNDLNNDFEEQAANSDMKAEAEASGKKAASAEENSRTETASTRGRGGPGKRGGRGGRGKVDVEEPLTINTTSTTTRGRGGRGRGSRGGRPTSQNEATNNEISETEMKSPPSESENAVAVRGGRGGQRGRGGRGNAKNSNNRRRSSETSTDSITNKQASHSTSGSTSTSVFDWPDMDEDSEMMASPTLKEEKAKRSQQTPEMQPEQKSPKQPRQRRSTGNRSSKDSTEEQQPQVASNDNKANNADTEEKIKAILEHAKQQEIEQKQIGLLKEVAASPSSSLSVYPTPAPTSASPSATSAAQIQPQRPTVLSNRTSSVPTTAAATVPAGPSSPASTATAASATRPGLSVVQLPTQPLPASEIARTTKQVLLEHKTAVVPQIAIPATSPRPPPPQQTPQAPTPISLPTQPVPISAASAASIVARTMSSAQPLPMLPQQPLPQMTLNQPKLPQHPLPPMSSGTSISVIPTARPASPAQPPPVASAPKPQQHMNPKKRVISLAEEEIKKEQQAEAAAAAAAAAQAASTSSVTVEKGHLKPRDAFGRGAHLVKEEKIHAPPPSTTITKIMTPSQPSSPSLVAQEQQIQQLALIRDQEINLLFQALVKQGNPEHIALTLAQEMAQDRYKNALAVAISSNVQAERSQNPGFAPGPLPAHVNDNRQSSSSPHVPHAHAHSRISTSNPYMHDPYADRHVIMSMNPPASPEPEIANLPNLDGYPMVWKGFIGLKNEFANVEFRYVSGCKDLAGYSLPHDPSNLAPTLRIGQRMRLEAAHLSGVRTKMQQPQEHCVLLALPCGSDPHDMAAQSRQLRSHFITYLQLKGAAGIVNVPGVDNSEQGGYVVHVFPSCDFANETMTSIAPDLLARVAEVEHMVIIIATVLDKSTD